MNGNSLWKYSPKYFLTKQIEKKRKKQDDKSAHIKIEKSDNCIETKPGGNLSKKQVSARLITKISLHTHESDLFSVAIFYLVLQLEDYTPLEDEAIYWHQYLRQAQQPKFLILNSTAILDFCNICRNLYLP